EFGGTRGVLVVLRPPNQVGRLSADRRRGDRHIERLHTGFLDGDMVVVDAGGHRPERCIPRADIAVIVAAAQYALVWVLHDQVRHSRAGGDVDRARVVGTRQPAILQILRNDLAGCGHLLAQGERTTAAFCEPQVAVGVYASPEVEVRASEEG